MVPFAGYEMPLSYEAEVGSNIAGGPGELGFGCLGRLGRTEGGGWEGREREGG